MRNLSKKIAVIFTGMVLLAVNLLNPVVLAASNIYELTFNNLFIFEQWANNANSGAVCSGTSGELTKDIASGSFTLVNTSTNEAETYTAYSPSIAGFYSMPVKPNTEYTFTFSVAYAEGATQGFDAFVFYYDASGTLQDNVCYPATNYGLSVRNFTTPEYAEYIQVRFDNNQPDTFATVSDIRICETEVYEYSKDLEYRKTYTYSSGSVYGELPTLEREGLVFTGWFTGPDGTGEKITADTEIAASSYSLYPKWEPINLENLTIISEPLKKAYTLGEKINTKGLVIGVTYPGGATENLDEGFNCSPSVFTESGSQTVTVTYGDKSADFTVNVEASVDQTFLLNGSETMVSMANYEYAINKTDSNFNRYEIGYSSDAYVKGELDFNGTTEEFFLEPSENGCFSGYIDGFINGTTQSTVTSVKFTPLNNEFMNFELSSIDLSNETNIGDSENMVYLGNENTDYTIGIDLDWGGALTYMVDNTNNVVAAKSNSDDTAPIEVGFYEDYDGQTTTTTGGSLGGILGGLFPGLGNTTTTDDYTTQSNVNLINCHDTGRLVQQSYYGTGDSSYEPGYYGEAIWPYNPVQGGNINNEASKIVDLQITDNEIYIKCRPLDWAKSADYITPSYIEAWYTLEDCLVRATCRFVDYSGYPSVTTDQEFPAFYCVEALNNFVYYTGGEAWSDNNAKTTLTDLTFWGTAPDQYYDCNENWGAFVGDGEGGYGIGLYAPGQTNFHPGVYQRDTITKITDDSGNSIDKQDATSYIGVVGSFNFQSYTPISYCYYMTTGDVDTIRSNFKALAQGESDICNATQTNGFCDMCGRCTPPELTTNKYDLNGDGSFENVYEISNAGELHWFRNYVNNGNVTANAVLTCDITDNNGVLTSYGVTATDTSSFRSWTPIGSTTNKYSGYFDGRGYTINGLYMNDSTLSYGGLFGYTDSNAVIKRVGIDCSCFCGNEYVGGISGYNAGTIENCYSFCIVAKGSSFAGGITGYNEGYIKNCYNTGKVNADNYIGGIAGSANSNGSFINCYYLTESATDGQGITQYGIGNTATGSNTEDVANATEGKTVKQFASGEVAYLLQGASTEQLWGQKSNVTGSAPVFDLSGDYNVTPVDKTGQYSLISIGDVDEDEDVDVNDYQQLINTVLSENYDREDYINMLHRDINGDGCLDALDATLMQRLINGHIEKLEVYLKGDFDCDGIAFTETDIYAMKKGLINQNKLSLFEKYSCDLNSDGILDINDRELLTRQEATVSKPVFLSMEDALTAE